MALGSSFSYYYGCRSDALWVHHNRVPRLPDLAAPRPSHRLCRGARRPTRPRQRLRRARRPGDSRRRGAAPRAPRALSPGRSASAARPDRRRTRRGPGPPQLRPRRRRPLQRARHQDARWRASGRERRAPARRPGRAAGRGRARGRALATHPPRLAARCGPGGPRAPDRPRPPPPAAGTRIRSIDAGTGPPVVFLHGLGASLYTWRHILPPIMQAGFRVIAFDNRGFGESEKPPTGYRNADYERLATALLDSLHIQDAVLVGHSMGGAIAAEVAIRDPQRVRGLVLIGAAGLGAREPMLFKVARWPVLGPLMVSFRGRSLTERLLRSTYADPEKITPADVDQYYAAAAYPGYGTALRAVLR